MLRKSRGPRCLLLSARVCARSRKQLLAISTISFAPGISSNCVRFSMTPRPAIMTSSLPTISSRTPTLPRAACFRCARTPAPPLSWRSGAGWSSRTGTMRLRSPRARATPISSAICAIHSLLPSPCSRRTIPSRTCRRRSRSMPAKKPTTRSTNSCSSPRAAARRTRHSCFRPHHQFSPTIA